MKTLKKLQEYLDNNNEVVLATVVDAKGSTPGRKAFKMIVADDGTFYGTVGGGAIEYEVVEKARKLIRQKSNLLKEFKLKDLNMICGGEVTVFFEYMANLRTLYILGGGHVGQAIEPIASSLGFRVIVVDNRPEVTTKELHPFAQEIICGDFYETIKNMTLNNPAYAIVLTNKHLHDSDCLRALLQKEHELKYIGMIGSMTKVKICLDELEKGGIKRDKIDKVYTPIGLDIGGDTPAEIAVGIMAELIAIAHDKKVPHMKNKS